MNRTTQLFAVAGALLAGLAVVAAVALTLGPNASESESSSSRPDRAPGEAASPAEADVPASPTVEPAPRAVDPATAPSGEGQGAEGKGEDAAPAVAQTSSITKIPVPEFTDEELAKMVGADGIDARVEDTIDEIEALAQKPPTPKGPGAEENALALQIVLTSRNVIYLHDKGDLETTEADKLLAELQTASAKNSYW